jgi:hypothetical protein
MSSKTKLIVQTGSNKKVDHQPGTSRINLTKRVIASTKPHLNRIKSHPRGGKQMARLSTNNAKIIVYKSKVKDDYHTGKHESYPAKRISNEQYRKKHESYCQTH